jgi:AcrR family transcriptional regulator
VNVRDKVVQAAERLASTRPYDRITYADIAAEAGVHWTAVRRHLGGRQEMRNWLQRLQTSLETPPADTRTRIMEAGAAVFARLGYHNTSLDKVAADAGLTKGAVYWHFSSKQELFLAILDHHLNKQLRVLPRQLDQALLSADPESALADWLAAQFCLPGEEDGRPMLFLEFVTSSREPEVRDRLRKVHGLMLDGAAAYFEEIQRKGWIRPDLDSQAVAIMVDALLKGLVVEWLIDPGRVQAKDMFRTISRILWHGMTPRKS